MITPATYTLEGVPHVQAGDHGFTPGPDSGAATQRGASPTVAALSVVTVPLATAQALDLTPAQTATWIMALYGIAGVLSLALTFTYRQPLLIGWNVTCVVFLASLAGRISYPEMLGATALTGGIVFLIGFAGLSRRVAALAPAPVVYGVVAGAILPFIIDIFTELPVEPLLIGTMLLVFLFSPRVLGKRIPAIVFALLIGVLVLALTGQIDRASNGQAIVAPEITLPALSFSAVVTIVPVFVALIALQGNLAAVVYLRGAGYQAPTRAIDLSVGAGITLGSMLGAAVLCMASSLTALTAGPEVGEHRLRHWSVYGTGATFVLVALLSGLTANIPAMIPLVFLVTLVGLATISVVAHALEQITRGPLRLGPLFAFVIALSDMTMFDLGPLFWSLVIGTAMTLVLERREWQTLRVAGV